MTVWTDEWIFAAERAIRHGDTRLGTDDLTGARRYYLRAATYYRLAMRGVPPRSPEWRSWHDGQTAAFRAALPLLPFDGTPLDDITPPICGYLFRPRRAPAPCPAVVVSCRPEPGVGGNLRCTPESMYEPVAVPILELGMACAVVATVVGDASRSTEPARPAQASELPGRVSRWLAGRPGIDPRRVSVAPG